MSVSLKQTIYWGVAALALLALAGPLPDVATMLVVILIIGVLLIHWSDYIGLLQAPASGATPAAQPTGGKGRMVIS